MLGFTWSEVDADASIESILESVRRGRCRPAGSTIPFLEYIRFYPQFITHRILREPRAAFQAACKVVTEIRKVRAYESIRTAAEHNHVQGDQISSRCIPARPLDWR
jgi:hypothetical protein